MIPPGRVRRQAREGEAAKYTADTLGKQLGKRFRLVPTGYGQRYLAEVCKGELIDAYAMEEFGQFAYMITRQGKRVRILVSNLQPESLRVNLDTLLSAAKVSVFKGDSWKSVPGNELKQPYGTTTKSVQELNHASAPPFSAMLIEGTPVE